MSKVEFILVFIVVIIAFAAWAVAVYSFFAMLGKTKKGWTSLVFRSDWLLPGKVDQHIEPDGIVHYRRFMKAFLCFFGAIFLLMLYGFAQVLLNH